MGIGARIRRTVGSAAALAFVLFFGPGLAWSAFPGENGRLVFETNRDGNYEIYSMEPDGSLPLRLTSNAVFDRQPVWSPDGTKVAFASNRSGRFEIWIANADGTSPARRTVTTTQDIHPAWSPDGSRIAFARSNPVTGTYDIWIVNAGDGSGLVRLTPDDRASESQPVWSPDGTKIAFVTDRDGNLEIYAMEADGSWPVNLTASPSSNESSPDWSPDGFEIAFESDRVDGLSRVFTMAADGSGARRLEGSEPGDCQPVWSPDGLEIALAGYRNAAYNLGVFRIAVGVPGSRELVGNPYAAGYHDQRPDWQAIPAVEEPENRPPVADAGPDGRLDCAPPGGAEVTLDGSGSSDPDSTPGTADDIVSFDWYVDRGLPSERLLGSGVTLRAVLEPGAHVVTLVVADRAGATDSDEAEWIVAADTTPPSLSLEAVPSVLWPPDHRMVQVAVRATAEDACGAAALVLISATSSEPDDAEADGSTEPDIQDAEPGTPDLEMLLRAERAGGGPGRVYTLVYSAIDAAGNVATAATGVTVPAESPTEVRTEERTREETRTRTRTRA